MHGHVVRGSSLVGQAPQCGTGCLRPRIWEVITCSNPFSAAAPQLRQHKPCAPPKLRPCPGPGWRAPLLSHGLNRPACTLLARLTWCRCLRPSLTRACTPRPACSTTTRSVPVRHVNGGSRCKVNYLPLAHGQQARSSCTQLGMRRCCGLISCPETAPHHAVPNDRAHGVMWPFALQAGGQRWFTLAFITANQKELVPAWAGTIGMEKQYMMDQVGALRCVVLKSVFTLRQAWNRGQHGDGRPVADGGSLGLTAVLAAQWPGGQAT